MYSVLCLIFSGLFISSWAHAQTRHDPAQPQEVYNTPLPAEGYDVVPYEWHPFVFTDKSAIEWRIDSETNTINFRRCQMNHKKKMVCLRPMLTKGIKATEMPLLIEYYLDRLGKVGGQKIWQTAGAVAASTAGLSAWLLTMVKALPARFSNTLQGTYHIGTVAATVGLLYFAYKIESGRQRQKTISSKLNFALERAPQMPPQILIESQSVFDEFATTFRRTLFEYTHSGGLSFDNDVYLILQ